MNEQNTYRDLSLHEWQILKGKHGSWAAAAAAVDMSATTLRSAIARLRRGGGEGAALDEPQDALKGAQAGSVGRVATPTSVLREQGLDEDAWELLSTTRLANGKVNVRVRPKRGEGPRIVMPEDVRGFSPPAPASMDPSTGYLVVVESDHQAPHNDPIMDALATKWWEHNRPNMAVIAGDLIELHTLSRHPIPRGGSASVARCFAAGHGILKRRLQASPDTEVVVVPGNHDDRVMDYLMREASALIELGLSGPLSLASLLRLDELPGNARMFEHPLGWKHTELSLAADLVVCHAITPPRGAGQTARAATARVAKSALVGDCHRQESSSVAGHLGYAIGCMCLSDDTYPAYMARPTWQHGFASVTLYPDGLWNVEFATRHGDSLFWRNQRFNVGSGK